MTVRASYVRTGAGAPGTVFAHGLAGSVRNTRPFGSGVRGTRVFVQLRSHADEADAAELPVPEQPWSYADLAAELRSAADATGATRALGVSLGAGALLRLLSQTPDRFERVVIVLPAALDEGYGAEQRARFDALVPLARAGDRAGVAERLVADQPEPVRERPDVRAWAREQADLFVRPDLVRAIEELPALRPVPDRSVLAMCTAEALVIGAEADPAHPVAVARQVADALPWSQLAIVGPGGLLWTHRERTRELIATFLNE